MSLQRFIYYFLDFLNDTVIPFIFAIAFLYFIWNVANYFIIKSDSDREKARNAALYGIGAFVVLVSLWGIVNLLVVGFGFNQENAVIPDYVCQQTGNCSSYSPTSGGSSSGGSFSGGSSSSGGSCTLGVFCSFNDRGVRSCEWCAMSD